jgi:uncharacterized membrane protein SpoIIM required for sporulation
MVLESIFNPVSAERRPWELFFIGLLYSSVAILLSLWIFKKESSMVMILLTVLVSVPLIFSTIKYEEKKDVCMDCGEKKLLEEHGRAIEVFVSLFLGFFVSFIIWYVFLPTDTVGVLFSSQSDTIASINGANVTGDAVDYLSTIMKIFLNNVRVLALCILFSFIYGAGAIFILAWNASVGGAFIGNLIRSKLVLLTGQPGLVHYFYIASLGIVRYIPHGILEMSAYFIGGLAGGIISVAIIRHDFKSEKFEKILFDSSDLVLISVVILLMAAFVEVFITPGIVSFWNGLFVLILA